MVINKKLVFQCHYLRGAGQRTLATLDAVGVEIAHFLSATVVGRELHRTDAGATLTLHLASTRDVDIGEGLGQRSMLRGYPA